MAGFLICCLALRTGKARMSDLILETRQLTKEFKGFTAVSKVDLAVQRGSIHALIGPNGAGKTTLIHQLSGALASDEGRILFAGDAIHAVAMPARVQRGLVRSYQITSIFKRLSVLENIALAVQARDGSSWRFWRPARHESARYALAAEVAARVGLAAQLQQPAGLLAHGEQRQLEVGLALATRPRMLLLDEPMAGMGPEESESMVTLLQQLRRDTTILLVEHDMDAVFRLADRISTLVFGKVIASGTPQEIRNHAEVKRAYLGDEAEEVAP